MRTPTQPGLVAYVGLGLLIAAGFVPLVFRAATAALRVPIGLSGNLFVVGALAVFLSAAGGLGCHMMLRYFRAVRAEDHAEREAREAQLRAEREAREAALRAEIDRQRAELADLNERVRDVEDKAWWGDPETDPVTEDTVDLSNVSFLPQRKQPPESKSS
jgi:hypothetical protein